LRVGNGYDIHRLGKGYPLIIGGVQIQYKLGCIAHSDGDVLLHAIIDSLLGAVCLGDIGKHFPPSDSTYKDISSIELLKKTGQMVSNAGYLIQNIDSTVILQEPKLAPYIPKMCEKIAKALNISVHQVSVKGKTKEHVDAAGRGEAIEAQTSVLIEHETA